MQDLSGRPHLSFDVDIPSERIGTYDTQLLEHFFQSLANTSGMTLHIRHALFLYFLQLLHIPCHPFTPGTTCTCMGCAARAAACKGAVLARHMMTELYTAEDVLIILLC